MDSVKLCGTLLLLLVCQVCGQNQSLPICGPLSPSHICSSLTARNSMYTIPQQAPPGVTLESESVRIAFLVLKQFQPPPHPDCVNALEHMMCIAAAPPCNQTTDLLLPICTESCLAFTRLVEERTCDGIIEEAQILAVSTEVKVLVLFVDLLLNFDCDEPSSLYLHDNVEELLGMESDGCTELQSANDTERILSLGNLCEPTPPSSICSSTFVSQYTHYLPLRSRNITSYQELLGEIVASGNISENCTSTILSLGCYNTYPPCDPETGDAIPLCTENCDTNFNLVQSCLDELYLNSNVSYGELDNFKEVFNCSDVDSYLPQFLHVASDQCINATDFNILVNSEVVAVSVIGGAVVGATVFLILVVALIVTALVLFHRKKSSSSHEIHLHGHNLTISLKRDEARDDRLYSMQPTTNAMENAQLMAVSPASSPVEFQLSDSDRRSYEKVFSSILVPYTALTIGEEIGQGAFGKVYQGALERPDSKQEEDVAIKTIKNLNSANEIEAFLAESLLMKDFSHPNILGLAGVCFDTADGVPYILLPFMANGSLKDFLKGKRKHVTNVDALPEGLDESCLVRMCLDVARGMEYLAENKFVHRDLAARNCLVDSSLVVRVGDFGLARDVYSSDYYRANQGARIPVKWMAPETLTDSISNEKTDVWSFGVTCWEVFSLGRGPYPGIQNQDILKHIYNNERLERPSLCPKMLCDILMSQCWRLLPEERPTFSQLVQQLQDYWEETHTYVVEHFDDQT